MIDLKGREEQGKKKTQKTKNVMPDKKRVNCSDNFPLEIAGIHQQ